MKIKKKINLLPPEFMEVERITPRNLVLFSISLAVILTVLSLHAWQSYHLNYYRKQIETKRKVYEIKEQNLVALQSTLLKVHRLMEDKRKLEERSALILPLLKGQAQWSGFLKELSNTIPPGVWLTELSLLKEIPNTKGEKSKVVPKERMGIKGMSFNNPLVAQFMNALERSPYFGEISLISTQKGKTYGHDLLTFEFIGELRDLMAKE